MHVARKPSDGRMQILELPCKAYAAPRRRAVRICLLVELAITRDAPLRCQCAMTLFVRPDGSRTDVLYTLNPIAHQSRKFFITSAVTHTSLLCCPRFDLYAAGKEEPPESKLRLHETQ